MAASAVHAAAPRPMHWDLEMTASEYDRALSDTTDRVTRDPELQAILDAGKRFFEWLNHINDPREPAKKISLTGAQFQNAYPIETPRRLNPPWVKSELAKLKAELPAAIGRVVFENAAFTDDPPMSDEEFARWGRRLGGIYESASRWILLEPWQSQLAERKRQDVRGQYYLAKEADLDEKLAGFGDLSADDQKRLGEWLVILCTNGSSTESRCRSEWQQAAATGDATAYHRKYKSAGQKNWDRFFLIGARRSDVEWGDVATKVPFRTPAPKIQEFLVTHIEDEWRWLGWSLKLDFSSQAAAHIVFEPNATPNVNMLAGDTITMDANQPLTEYGVQWTIRHEFGHVLGLPDCYLEFYDRSDNSFVSYQLDTTNLMCSRRGKLKDVHYEELRKAYLTP